MPNDPKQLKAIARRISTRFRTPFHRHFAYWKVRMDPLYWGVGETLKSSRLPVLDVGCGSGLLCFYLLERGVKAPLHGMDFDAGKIDAAQQAAAHPHDNASAGTDPSPTFHLGDVRQPWPDVKGHVCLLDVLQYLPHGEQRHVLETAAAQVAGGGLLVVRSGIRENNWRYRFTLFIDRLMNRLRLMKSPPVFYPDKKDLEGALVRVGLTLKSATPLHQGTPF
ncbi:MAG: class I SAM-dependent methyltransferase, partial [Verrucomicrobium sp.]